MINSIKDWHAFESEVCSIIYKTNPISLSHYDGGPDRGRDILVELKEDNICYNIIVECKYYTGGVGKGVIMPALDWAKVYRPDLLYFWIVPYLTPDTKDFIELFKNTYHINVLFEEEVNIVQYLKYLTDDNNIIWKNLREKVVRACTREYLPSTLFAPGAMPSGEADEPYLIDREDERKTLLNTSGHAFFIQGVSASGKTQLMKYIHHIYAEKGCPVFWYTLRSEDAGAQCSSFFHMLSHYFLSIHHDAGLISYFQEYGYCLSQDLEKMITTMLNKHHPIMFLDDAHNCQHDNVTLRTLFEKIIEYGACRIYFAGWFNIFKGTLKIEQNLSITVIDGLGVEYLNQIIQHYSGHYNTEVAGVISERFNGLPGYAVLVDQNTTASDLASDHQFLHTFLKHLNAKEQALLFMLIFSTLDIPADYLSRNGHATELESLRDKRLVLVRDGCYTVHDKYRPYFSQYPVENTVFCQAVSLMMGYAGLRPELYFDIISAYLERNDCSQAWELLSANFKILLHCQQNLRLLNLLQKIEQKNIRKISYSDIILDKIILLERCGEYQLCWNYITLLEDQALFSRADRQMLLYLSLRALYFTNRYDDLLDVYGRASNLVEELESQELRAQILLIIGRVYYIRGLLNGAFACYMLSYQYAFAAGEKPLEAKAIHRLAMIECCQGLTAESKKTFDALAALQEFITPKRRSYIFYRIAKCDLLEGRYAEAKENNKKSIKIKSSYADERGLMFSAKLDARINLAMKNYIDADCSISRACNMAVRTGLRKEWLACMLVQIKIIIASSSSVDLHKLRDDLRRCLDIAVDEKLLHRLESIRSLSEGRFEDIYQAAEEKIAALSAELSEDEDQIISSCKGKMEAYIQKNYETMICEHRPITRHLLLRSGFCSLDSLRF